MNIELTPNELAARYQLLCRSTQVEAAKDPQVQQIEGHLQALNKLLKHDLRALARRGSPDDFADIYFALEQELERFHEFCSFPALAQKFVVAFGGGFSAGKSSLINTLLGKRLLVTEVDPTTSLPTYLLKGEHDAVHAHNLFGHRIDLSTEEFLSLTHDEIERYGSNISRLLRSAFITRADFPWNNLALIDTPGYTKHEDQTQGARTDEHIARTQLNAAQAIVWVIDARKGCITEDDLQFLATVQADIPRLIVVSRADQKPAEEISAIVQGIKATLSERNLPFMDVIPVSARQKQEWPVETILMQLAAWSRQPHALRFAHNFKAQFTRYANFIEEEQRQAQRHLNRLNRILVMAENRDVQADATELKGQAAYSLTAAKERGIELLGLRHRFFSEIRAIADAVGIAQSQLLERDQYFDTVLSEGAPPLKSSISPAPFTVEYSYFNYTGDTVILSLKNGVRLKIEPGNSFTTSDFIIKVVYRFSQHAAERLCTFLANRDCPADDPLYPFKVGLLTHPYKQDNRFIVIVDYRIERKEFGMKGGSIYVSDTDILLTKIDSIDQAEPHPHSVDGRDYDNSTFRKYAREYNSDSGYLKHLPAITLGLGTALAAVSVVAAEPQQADAYEAPLHWRSPPTHREAKSAAITETIALHAGKLPAFYGADGLFTSQLMMKYSSKYRASTSEPAIGATSLSGVTYCTVLESPNGNERITYEWLGNSNSYEQLGQRVRLLLDNGGEKYQLCDKQARELDNRLATAMNRMLHRQLYITEKDLYITSFANDISALITILTKNTLYSEALPAMRKATKLFVATNTFVLTGGDRDAAIRNRDELRRPAPALAGSTRDKLTVAGVPTMGVFINMSSGELGIDMGIGQTRALIATEHRQLATLARTLVDIINPVTDTPSRVIFLTLDCCEFELDKGLLGDYYYLVTRLN